MKVKNAFRAKTTFCDLSIDYIYINSDIVIKFPTFFLLSVPFDFCIISLEATPRLLTIELVEESISHILKLTEVLWHHMKLKNLVTTGCNMASKLPGAMSYDEPMLISYEFNL